MHAIKRKAMKDAERGVSLSLIEDHFNSIKFHGIIKARGSHYRTAYADNSSQIKHEAIN